MATKQLKITPYLLSPQTSFGSKRVWTKTQMSLCWLRLWSWNWQANWPTHGQQCAQSFALASHLIFSIATWLMHGGTLLPHISSTSSFTNSITRPTRPICIQQILLSNGLTPPGSMACASQTSLGDRKWLIPRLGEVKTSAGQALERTTIGSTSRSAGLALNWDCHFLIQREVIMTTWRILRLPSWVAPRTLPILAASQV